MSTHSEAEILLAMAALGRPNPPIDFASMRSVRDRSELLAAWDEANPLAAASWRALQTELEALANESARLAHRQTAAARGADQAKLKRIVGAKIAEVLLLPSETAALTAAREWDSSRAWALVLMGTPGNGKSVAAAWLVRQRIERGLPALWLRAEEVAAYRGREARVLKSRARGADLIVIDDFGDELGSPQWRAWLRDVLGARYERAARTVLTSNLDPEGFKLRVGARLADRFRDGWVIGTTAPSMRGAQAGATP